jgi:hypothetical protein
MTASFLECVWSGLIIFCLDNAPVYVYHVSRDGPDFTDFIARAVVSQILEYFITIL